MASFEFLAESEEAAYEVLSRDLPPLDNLKIESVELIGADPDTKLH